MRRWFRAGAQGRGRPDDEQAGRLLTTAFFGEINNELADKGFLVTSSSAQLITWARTGSLDVDAVRSCLLCCRDDADVDAAL